MGFILDYKDVVGIPQIVKILDLDNPEDLDKARVYLYIYLKNTGFLQYANEETQNQNMMGHSIAMIALRIPEFNLAAEIRSLEERSIIAEYLSKIITRSGKKNSKDKHYNPTQTTIQFFDIQYNSFFHLNKQKDGRFLAIEEYDKLLPKFSNYFGIYPLIKSVIDIQNESTSWIGERFGLSLKDYRCSLIPYQMLGIEDKKERSLQAKAFFTATVNKIIQDSEMVDDSDIMSHSLREVLTDLVPFYLTIQGLTMLYSITRDGMSYKTYANLKIL